MKTNMRKPLEKAYTKAMLEIVKDKDLEALIYYLEFLSDMYSYENTMDMITEVSKLLFSKYPDAFEWLMQNKKSVEEGKMTAQFMVTVEDLIYLLKSEGNKIKGIDFKDHPNDINKIITTKANYDFLKKVLAETYQMEEGVELEINIDELVEISENV